MYQCNCIQRKNLSITVQKSHFFKSVEEYQLNNCQLGGGAQGCSGYIVQATFKNTIILFVCPPNNAWANKEYYGIYESGLKMALVKLGLDSESIHSFPLNFAKNVCS